LVRAQESRDVSSGEVIALLKVQNSELANDIRQIHREIAALRADLDEPGMKEVFAGIGYIVGLFGMAAFAAARRRRQ
jgi:nickel transport protein